MREIDNMDIKDLSEKDKSPFMSFFLDDVSKILNGMNKTLGKIYSKKQ